MLEGLEEVALVAEEPLVQEVHDGPQVEGAVLEGCAREHQAEAAAQGARCLGLPGVGVLDVLGLVQNDPAVVAGLEQVFVPLQQAVAGEDDVVFLGHLLEVFGLAQAGLAVVELHVQARGEAVELPTPVPQDTDRADHQHGELLLLLLAPVQDHGDGLDGLAQAHVVCQAGAEALVDQVVDPGVAPCLVGAHLADEVLGHRA